MRAWVIGAIAVLATAVVVGAAFGAWRGGSYLYQRFHGSEPLPPVAYQLPLPPPPARLPWVEKSGVDAYGYPRKQVSTPGFLVLLYHKRYAELTSYIEELQQEFERDPFTEYWVTDAIGAFDMPDPALGPLLDEWLQQSPRSFAPYAARGAYRSALGWHARGTELAKDTSRAQFAAFDRYLKESRDDLEKAIEIEPQALAPHLKLLSDGKHHHLAHREFERAVAKFPRSFRLLYAYMGTLEPKWGGSYAKLDAFARATAARARENPKFAILHGVIHALRCEDRLIAKDYLGALAAANDAVAAGEQGTYLAARGRAKMYLQDYEGSLADLDHSLDLRPDDARVLLNRALVLGKLTRWREAGESYIQALRADPTGGLEKREHYAEVLEFAGHQELRAGRPQQALRNYENALLLDRSRAEAKRFRDQILRVGDPNANEPEVTAALERARKEDSFEAYRALDDVLAKRGRFSEILAYWTEFIGRHPNEGRAYVERGGTLTHIQKFGDAIKDAQHGCDLGVQVGCQYATQFRDVERRYQASQQKAR